MNLSSIGRNGQQLLNGGNSGRELPDPISSSDVDTLCADIGVGHLAALKVRPPAVGGDHVWQGSALPRRADESVASFCHSMVCS